MIFALLVAAATAAPAPAPAVSIDPRLELVELVSTGQLVAALDRTTRALEQDPRAAGALGLALLRGDLLERLGREREAVAAYAAALGGSGGLEPWSRLRLALLEERLGHPEIAAGLVATLLAHEPPDPLVTPGLELLHRALERGGDCRLLVLVRRDGLSEQQRRVHDIAQADCWLREGRVAEAASVLRELLEDDVEDAVSWEAAGLLVELPGGDGPDLARLLGLTAYHHREFRTALARLERARSASPGWFATGGREIEYALARSHFWLGGYDEAARAFGSLSRRPSTPAARADALCQLARAHELGGRPAEALGAFRRSFEEDPDGEWAGAAMLGAIRLLSLDGNTRAAWDALARLAARPQLASATARAALFLAVTELLAGRTGRVASALDLAARTREAADEEVAYWRGRLAESTGSPATAVSRYLEVLELRPFHPLAAAARRRLGQPGLAPEARRRGLELAQQEEVASLHRATLLLGEQDPDGRRARERGLERLAGRRRAADWVRWTPVPVAEWPLWAADRSRPEDQLLSLGLFVESRDAFVRHFPNSRPRLAFTGAARLLERDAGVRRGIAVAEALFENLPREVPAEWVTPDLRRMLYPFPWAALIRAQASAYRIDPSLLAALIREESRFDPGAESPASARGLAQLTRPTAQRLAGTIGIRELRPRDLHRPEISIALGAAHLAELARRFPASEPVVIAAYNAGEDQAALWRRSCATREPEEYLAKIGFRETKAYVIRVLESRALYRALYAGRAE